MYRTHFLYPCLLALTLTAHHVRAETHDPVAAQALFDDARRLASAGQYAEACPKFAESQRLDPGIGTSFNLADCYEKTGRVASAWALFLEVVSQARASGETEREAAAKTRASKLEPRLPKLKIRVAAETQPAGLEITRDGVAVGPAQWGSMVPVDPGQHELIARAPGRQSFSRTLQAEEGVVLDFELPPLAPSTETAAAPAAPPAGPPLEEKATPAAHSGPNPWVYALGGVGIVGLGVGTTFAFMAMSDNKDSKANCRADDPNKCTTEGIEQRNSAIKKGNAATVGFVVGGVGIASALVVWLVGGSGGGTKSGLRAGADIGQNGGELHLSGSF